MLGVGCWVLVAFEIDNTVGEFACLVLRVDAFEFDEGSIIVSETVFLKEKWHKNPFGLDDDMIGIGAVEHVVVEHEVHFSFHTVGFPDASYGIYLLLLDHLECWMLVVDTFDVRPEFVES